CALSTRLRVSVFCFSLAVVPPPLLSFPTRRSSDLVRERGLCRVEAGGTGVDPVDVDPGAVVQVEELQRADRRPVLVVAASNLDRSEEHTSELQSRFDLVCRLLLEKKKKDIVFACFH